MWVYRNVVSACVSRLPYPGRRICRGDNMHVSLRSRILLSTVLTAVLTGFVAIVVLASLGWASGHMIMPVLGILAAGFIISVGVSTVFTRSLMVTLHKLADEAGHLADNETNIPDNHTISDDVTALEHAITAISTSIARRDRELQEKCREVSEAKRLSTLGQLAAGVAHEINNPLGGIFVYANLLLEDTPRNDPRYSNITKIIRESNRCKNIVKSLLDFARQSDPVLNSADINAIITEALNNIRREEIFEGIEIKEQYGAGLPPVMVDASQIQEVFENIIRNAAEVMDTSGILTIVTRLDGTTDGSPNLGVSIADTGPGIPEDHLEHIFDPFFTTKKQGHGTGLGLSVSYGIVERHGGTVTAENRAEGGVEFHVSLPVGDKNTQMNVCQENKRSNSRKAAGMEVS